MALRSITGLAYLVYHTLYFSYIAQFDNDNNRDSI